MSRAVSLSALSLLLVVNIAIADPPTARSLRVVVLDPAGKPLPGATIHSGIWTEEKDFKANRDYLTAADGSAKIDLPKNFYILRLWASKKPFTTMFAGWEQEELASLKEFPAEYTFRLENAVTAGGRVVDEQGKPVAGAKIQVRLSGDAKPAKSDGRVRYDSSLAYGDAAATTDADGRWQIANVPDDAKAELILLVTHPTLASDEIYGESQKASGVTTAELRKGTARLTLKAGVPVHGRVTDPAGKPVKDALVVIGDRPYFGNTKQEFLTDADGQFALPSQAPKQITLTVIAPGFAPQLRKLNLQADTPSQEFRLEPGKPIKLRIVDAAGKAVEAGVYAIEWKGSESLNAPQSKIPRKPNADGVWEWTWAPDGPVKLRVGLKGFAPSQIEIAGGAPERTVVLKAEHRVTGRVTDAVTGKPIPAFIVIPIDVFRSELVVAERYNAVRGRDGRLEYRAERPDIPVRLRVEAVGYRTQDGPEFRVGDNAARVQDFRLQPSSPITGTVVDAAGKPVAKVNVLMATASQPARLVDDFGNQKVMTDATGRFAFPDPGEAFALIARSEAGFARAELPVDRHDVGELRLQPWASVRGRFRDGGQAVRGASVTLHAIRLGGPGRLSIDDRLNAQTDDDGRFEFPRVPPDVVNVSVYLGPWRDEGYRSGPSVPLDLKQGQRVDLDLGGAGAVVSGNVKLTGKVPADLDCTYSLNFLIRREPGVAPPAEIAALGFDIRKGWRDAWANSVEGQAYLSTLQRWFVKLSPDGTFRVSGVPPGEYDLAIGVYAKPEGCLIDPLARRVVRITVAGADVTVPEIAAEVAPIPTIGDTPALAFNHPGAGDGKLADTRGKYVVVHFWASWCAPCKQQFPALKKLHDRFGARGVTFLGLSLDEDEKAWKAALKRVDLPWSHGRLAANVGTGVSSVPVYWLLDPTGKIVAKAYEPGQLIVPVTERLK